MASTSAVYDVPSFHKTLYEEQKNEKTDTIGTEGDKKVSGFSNGFMPELFHTLYATTPTKVEKPGAAAAIRQRMHNLVHELPEFEALRKQTVRDPMWSSMATIALGENVAKTLPVSKNKPDADAAEKALQGLQHLASEGLPVSGEMLAAAEGKARGEAYATAEQAEGLDETALRNAMRAGIAEAGEQISDAEAALTALGYGSGSGANAFRTPQVAMALAKKVSTSQKLKKIMEIAGRLIATARNKRASRTNYARSEIIGVEPTNNLARILPSEMVHLGSKLGTALLFKRIVERSALGYSMRGKEKQAKGPIVLVLDQSGSMAGDKDIWAKGVALALLDTAKAEKRAFGIILFDDMVKRTLLCPDSNKANPSHILDILSASPMGGTQFHAPMQQAMEWIEQVGVFNKADVVLITDGEAPLDRAEEIKAKAKIMGASIYGIGIGLYRSGGLDAWTDKATCIDDVKADAAAVNTIFDNVGGDEA